MSAKAESSALREVSKRLMTFFETRELVSYGIVGLVQLAVDCSLFVFATAMGVHTAGANVLGRVSGALLGYFGNSRFTFAPKDGARHRDSKSIVRFAIVWSALTVVSSAAVVFMDHHVSLQAAWFLKPVVEVVLAGCGFLAGKLWIYKRSAQRNER